MGIYVNPGNTSFARIDGPRYVDKTGLIALMNERVGKDNSLVCVSRPRRFGKSYAAKMLTAYYDCSCDSHVLFEDKRIAKERCYEKYINKYNVICLDITGFISNAQRSGRPLKEVPADIVSAVWNDLKGMDPDISNETTLEACMLRCVGKTNGKPFIFIIDEWDALIREAGDDEEAQKRYLNLLRGWFKNENFTPKAVAAAYMTGILPIKKDGSQSAISDFKEYSVIKPHMFGPFVGFTEDEVRQLCERHQMDFEAMKYWYDGYDFRGVGAVYNPNSVMQAIDNKDFDSYWAESSAAEGLMEYISKPYHGMAKTIAELIGGIDVKVNTNGFANDLVTFKGKDDVLTLMIHLGYLAFDAKTGTVHIPNEEIKQEFQKAIRVVDHAETIRRLEESDQLFLDTINGNEKAVAAQIEKVHREETAPLHYNKEDSLRSVIKLAYYTYREHYVQFEELPSGEGYADIVYIPKHDSDWPALVIELKWNESAEGAIAQINKKKYPESLAGFGSNILLVGISYDKESPAGERQHTCRIEKVYAVR